MNKITELLQFMRDIEGYVNRASGLSEASCTMYASRFSLHGGTMILRLCYTNEIGLRKTLSRAYREGELQAYGPASWSRELHVFGKQINKDLNYD